MVIPAFVPRDPAGLFLGPVRQSDGRRERGFCLAGAEDHQIICRQLHAVKRHVIVSDNLTDIEAELLEGRVAACLVLEVGETNLPFLLLAAVFAGNLVDAPFERSAQAEIVVGDRHDLVALDRAHDPIRENNLAVIEPPCVRLHDETALVDQAEDSRFAAVACGDVRLEGGAAQPIEGLFQAFVFNAAGFPVGGNCDIRGGACLAWSPVRTVDVPLMRCRLSEQHPRCPG